MLTQRKEQILRIIVGEYVSTACPVGSERIAREHGLGFSPATIRNEMSDLEDDGYILHRHTSAGRIPSDKGYRYYVEWLMDEAELSPLEQRMIRHQFHQVEMELEQWTRLTAAVVARAVRNVALVTLPRAPQARLKHLELVTLQEFLALLVLVLEQAKLRQQVLHFDEPITQEELDHIAARLNAAYAGLTGWQIPEKALSLSPKEERVALASSMMMQALDEQAFEEVYLDGVRHLLAQPEFSSVGKVRPLLEVLEDRSVFREILPYALSGEGVSVVIGSENRAKEMQECSLVLSRYGVPSGPLGVLGVLGPTRLEYWRVVPTVRYLASVMGELVAELSG